MLEQAPTPFSIVAKENMVWLVYAFSWAKIYIEPDMKDLVVSYKVMDADKALKIGTITVKNTDSSKNIRFFQSKVATNTAPAATEKRALVQNNQATKKLAYVWLSLLVVLISGWIVQGSNRYRYDYCN